MRRTIPALLVVFVVLSTAVASAAVLPGDASSVGTASPDVDDATSDTAGESQPSTAPVVPSPNTTSYLVLSPERVRSNQYGSAGLDVASAVEMDAGRLRGRYLETAVVRSFRQAETDANRTAALRSGVRDVANRTTVLERRQSRALAQYNAGEITTGEYLRRLAVIDARAARLDAALAEFRRETSRSVAYSPPNSLRERLIPSSPLRGRLALLQSPIRDGVARSVTGERAPSVVYVQTADDGYVLGSVVGSTYFREATDNSQFQIGGIDQFVRSNQTAITAAYDRASQLYPWVFDNDIATPDGDGFGRTTLYRFNIDHTQGRLITYMDGTTTNVFREIHEKRLASLPLESSTNSTETLLIRVNRSHETGPMRIEVLRPETGRPVDARVTVDGTFVGQTGTDGTVWTVRPVGPATVNATVATGQRVTLDLPAGN